MLKRTLKCSFVCDFVYAELCAYFAAQRECDPFLQDTKIRVESLTREAHFRASLPSLKLVDPSAT